MEIKDSGSRTEFPSGAVRDLGGDKGRCDLMPLDVVAMCYRAGFPSDVTDKVFTDIHLFTETGDCAFLVDALSRKEPFESWSDMFLEVSKHFAAGCEKYGENNWKKGIPVKSYINSGVRHYLKWLRGDTDEPHDRAFVWNIMCAIWTCVHKPELNDYRKKPCPVCGNLLPIEAKECEYCRVHIWQQEHDPDSFIGEYEEENG